MEIAFYQAQGRVPVTVLQPRGSLDASNYKELIAKGQEVCDAGTRYILLDLGGVSFMSSSGLVALHSIAMMLRGEALPESGWDAFRAIGQDSDRGVQQRVKLLNPQPNVDKVLTVAGFKQFFEVHTDAETAIASF